MNNNDNEEKVLEETENNETNENNETKELLTADGEVENKKKDSKFLKLFLATIIDEVIVLVGSTVLVYVANFLMQFLGYEINQIFEMIIIVFLIATPFYLSIMGTSKGTVGNNICNKQ